MKKLIMTICLLAATAAYADEVVLGGDVWCPINCEPDTDNPGYMIEIARRALAPHGHTVVYRVLPWARAIEEARRGKINGIIGAFKEDAPDFVFPEVEQSMLGDIFYVKKDATWKYTGLDSLQDISLGVILDYAYTEELDPYVKANLKDSRKIQAVDGDDALPFNIRKLLRGRVDAVVECAPVFWYTAGTMGITDKVKEAGAVPEKTETYLAFSPAPALAAKSAEYTRLISEGTQKLRESGELAKILAKYNLKDWRDE